MNAISDERRRVVVVTTTDNDCAREGFCEGLRRSNCDVQCVGFDEVLRLRSKNCSVLIDDVNPAQLPQARTLLKILSQQRPLPRCVVVLLPDKDYEGLQKLSFPFQIAFHYHKPDEELSKVYRFLTTPVPDEFSSRSII